MLYTIHYAYNIDYNLKKKHKKKHILLLFLSTFLCDFQSKIYNLGKVTNNIAFPAVRVSVERCEVRQHGIKHPVKPQFHYISPLSILQLISYIRNSIFVGRFCITQLWIYPVVRLLWDVKRVSLYIPFVLYFLAITAGDSMNIN